MELVIDYISSCMPYEQKKSALSGEKIRNNKSSVIVLVYSTPSLPDISKAQNYLVGWGDKKFNIELLLLYCHSTFASAVNRKVHTVVASRGIIRVTVTIGDCQARVSSSSEGCSTSQKTVKV